MDAHRVKLTNNDEIAITSILTLPEPTVQFSQVNLPGSSLLVKANLNLHFLNYWQLLKQRTNIMPIEIDGLDNELEFNDGNFVDNIKNYMLNLSDYEMPGNIKLTNLEIYNQFLKIIIPKIIVLFNLIKKYIKGKLSMSNLITYLEPFMIYSNDLTYMNYKEIEKFITEKIREYNSKYVEYSRAFGSIKSIKVLKTVPSSIFEIFNNVNHNARVVRQVLDSLAQTLALMFLAIPNAVGRTRRRQDVSNLVSPRQETLLVFCVEQRLGVTCVSLWRLGNDKEVYVPIQNL